MVNMEGKTCESSILMMPADQELHRFQKTKGVKVLKKVMHSVLISHQVGGSRKRSYQSPNADQKSLETVFSIAICRPSGDKWQSKKLFLTVFDLRSLIVLAFSIAAYPVCI